MVVDFPKNVGHVDDYVNLKEYVYNHIVRNITCKALREGFLAEACRLWPTAAIYFQELAKEKHGGGLRGD